ncbi:MAG: ATP-binding cassette domain-containing protein [Lentisphaeria bacterium]
MLTLNILKNTKIPALIANYPYIIDTLKTANLHNSTADLNTLAPPDSFCDELLNLISQMELFLGNDDKVNSITILPGFYKNNQPETFSPITITAGEVVSIVGPTGSGKSRLLADIEWLAQNDTPTKRTILINENTPNPKSRFSIHDKLVAQLSQNMNFIMDLSVQEFLEIHASSRLIANPNETIQKIILQANALTGEKFTPDSPITSLSGGQSRALMIADTAILSKSPIVLIDEIENAGVDRQKALELLISNEKIVLIATHDPILALLAKKRIVIKNGGIDKIISSTAQEQSNLQQLQALDQIIQSVRNRLRQGDIINNI